MQNSPRIIIYWALLAFSLRLNLEQRKIVHHLEFLDLVGFLLVVKNLLLLMVIGIIRVGHQFRVQGSGLVKVQGVRG